MIEVELHIDCDPWTGMGRQGDHFRHICENILHCDYYEPISKWFGDWVWKVKYTDSEQREKVGEFLRELYEEGRVRYVHW